MQMKTIRDEFHVTCLLRPDPDAFGSVATGDADADHVHNMMGLRDTCMRLLTLWTSGAHLHLSTENAPSVSANISQF
jgi:hypothetical protein